MLSKEISEVFAKLPAGFFGSVEVHYTEGRPRYVRIMQTQQLTKDPTGKNQGEPNDRTDNRLTR